MSSTNTPQAGTPICITVSPVDKKSVFYKFIFRENQGTSLYDTSPWKVVKVCSQVLIALFLLTLSTGWAAGDGGYDVTTSLWAKAVLQVSTSPVTPVTLKWKAVGTDITPSGDQVISGYFYADPNDFAYGSPYNPEVFVKIYIAANGWCNIAFNHVTVDPVSVYSAHNYNGTPQKTATIKITPDHPEDRLSEHQYNDVSIDGNLSASEMGAGSTLASTASGGGYIINSGLWAKAVLQPASGPVTLVWKEVGIDTTATGARVVSGYFYADPNDFAHGSEFNPEVFIKIYIDPNGWANIAANHVTVDSVSFYSSYQYNGTANQSGVLTLANRLGEHPYTGVSIEDANPPLTGSYTLLAWNDLGMHCMDGLDYSVFSILPPFNNLHAQLVRKDAVNNKLISAGVSITYEASAYPGGAINTSSATPTNFWDFVSSLYDPLFGPIRGVDFGLKGNPTQSYTPAPLSPNTTFGWWEAQGMPTDPYNDDGTKDFYPLVKVVAKDPAGNLLATTTTVLPVSDEMNCRACHASGGSDAAKPDAGWVNLSNSDKDYKFNILRRHDDRHAIGAYLGALAQNGYVYKSSLYETSLGGTPVLCSACHASNALPGTGVEGPDPLTTSLHGLHAEILDPDTGQRLNDIANRTACYRCHPGAETKCLRGAMGAAVKPDGTSLMSCQSCHGSISDVGTEGRMGWLTEPNCQSCHFNGQRQTDTGGQAQNGSQDTRFATNPDTPMTGTSLFRFSTGHGGLQCEACHGATHAIYPSAEPGDNYQSLALQNHTGTIAECGVCHSQVPDTTNGGPHGLHTVGQTWVRRHESVAEHGSSQCAACHGETFQGGLLSKTSMSRSFQVEDGSISFSAGHSISCYDCHNGPNGGD